MESDAKKWDERYSTRNAPQQVQPPEVVSTYLGELARHSRTLDVASGWGDAGLFLAQRGALATFADISSVALTAVTTRARTLGVEAATITIDLATHPVPEGPWDAITCVHYLDRELLPRLGNALSPGGRLVCAIATIANLERHDRPSARFLLETGELLTLVPELTVEHSSEAWRANNVHEAWLVATRT